jgi:hypothetical protein
MQISIMVPQATKSSKLSATRNHSTWSLLHCIIDSRDLSYPANGKMFCVVQGQAFHYTLNHKYCKAIIQGTWMVAWWQDRMHSCLLTVHPYLLLLCHIFHSKTHSVEAWIIVMLTQLQRVLTIHITDCTLKLNHLGSVWLLPLQGIKI